MEEKKELSLEKLEEIENAYLDLMKAYSSCLSILGSKKVYMYYWQINKNTYRFSWDNVPGDDSEILIRFLTDILHIGWAENVEIHKSDDGKTILIFTDENSAEIMIDKKKKNATLNISNGRTLFLNVKKKHGKLNIYPKIKHGAWLDLQKESYRSMSNRLHLLLRWFAEILILDQIVSWKIKRRVDLVRQAFQLLITQNRNKIDSEHIKRFEIYCEDMDGLSPQRAKYGFPAITTCVVSLLPVVVPMLISIAYNYLMKSVFNFILIIYLLGYVMLLIFVIVFFGFIDSRRVFSETTAPEKEKKIFNLIQEYLEFE